MATVPRLDSIAQTTPCFPSEWTLADIHRLLGDIPLNRIVIQPPLGSATESDVERRRAALDPRFPIQVHQMPFKFCHPRALLQKACFLAFQFN